jgi:hypothetical protein
VSAGSGHRTGGSFIGILKKTHFPDSTHTSYDLGVPLLERGQAFPQTPSHPVKVLRHPAGYQKLEGGFGCRE